nr:DNA-packaging protein [Clostridium sp. Cult2]
MNIVDDTKDLTIKDVIQDALNYCNLKELPIELEPYVRKKVKSIIDYEAENGTTSVFDIKSIKEGDTSITYNVDDKTSKETIYGLSDRDKKTLQQFRRTRK